MGDDLLHDGESDAGADFAGLFGALSPVEFLPDLFELVGAHADAFILHGNAEHTAL